MKFIARAGDISITPEGGSAVVPKSNVSVSFSDDSQMVEEFDLDSQVPYHFHGNHLKTVTLETRDFDLWFAFNDVKCASALTINVTAPVASCDPGDERVTVAIITGTHLALTSAREFQTGQDGGRATYSMTFARSHSAAGVEGTLDFEAAVEEP